MATEVPQVGCPHCRGTIAVAPAMLGRVVECPHCRGQLQLPDTVPGVTFGPKPSPPASMYPASPTGSVQVPVPSKPAAAKKPPVQSGTLTVMTGEDLNFAGGVEPDALERRNVERSRAEPPFLKHLETYAVPFVACGIAGTLMLSIAVVFYAVVPVFRESAGDGSPAQKLIPAILLSLAVLAFFCASIVVWLILRLTILTLVDIARSLRQIRAEPR